MTAERTTNETFGEQMTTGDNANTYETTWSDHPSTSIAMAVAEATGREPAEGPVLDHYVDTDALDDLLDGEKSHLEDPIRVSFTYADVAVTVDSDGRITVRTPPKGRE